MSCIEVAAVPSVRLSLRAHFVGQVLSEFSQKAFDPNAIDSKRRTRSMSYTFATFWAPSRKMANNIKRLISEGRGLS